MSKGKRSTKKEDSDLGRALLQRRCIPGVGLSQEDIGAWWGCSRQRIQQYESGALRKIRNLLRHTSPDNLLLRDGLMMELFERRSAAMPRSVRE